MNDTVPQLGLSRRALLRGATVVAAAGPVAVLLASEDAYAVLGDSDEGAFAGRIATRPSPRSAEIQIPGAERILVEVNSQTTIVQADGGPGTLDSFEIGDAVAVTFDPREQPSAEAGAVVSARMSPAVLGQASDLDVVRT